ncbi:MAG TPA: hypothetical protein VJY34_03325 [Roseiarcus sp.]|nr:hypothetical protein [Roseiarcus sp.]
MADSEKGPHCYEGASRFEHDFAPRAIDTRAALAAAVFAVAAKVRRAFAISLNRHCAIPGIVGQRRRR